MDNKFGRDLTVGSIPRHLLSFSLPMLAGNMLQSGYSIINMIWVGNIVGPDGLGATAVSFPIMFILIGLGAGATMATSVLVAQYYGAKNYALLKKVVDNSVAITLSMSVVLTIFGIIFSDFLLKLMDTPPAVFEMASSYLKISLGGFILLAFMFVITSVLRGIGDTVTPLMFMGAAVILNAILDPLMITGKLFFPRMGLNGAAWASVISQAFGLVLGFIYLNRKNHIISIRFHKLAFDKHISGLILKIGFPSMIQQSLISIGTAFVTTYINYFGAPAIAAFGAASRIDMVATMPAMAIGMAATALTGQNLGAKKPERVHDIFKWALILGIAISGFISILAVAFPQLILSMFIQDKQVLDIGVHYLRIVGPSYVMVALMFVANGIVNGAGQTMITMVFTLFSLWVFRVPLAANLSKTSLGLTGIWIAITVSFTLTSIISCLYYLSGRWKKSAIKLQVSSDDIATAAYSSQEPG